MRVSAAGSPGAGDIGEIEIRLVAADLAGASVATTFVITAAPSPVVVVDDDGDGVAYQPPEVRPDSGELTPGHLYEDSDTALAGMLRERWERADTVIEMQTDLGSILEVRFLHDDPIATARGRFSDSAVSEVAQLMRANHADPEYLKEISRPLSQPAREDWGNFVAWLEDDPVLEPLVRHGRLLWSQIKDVLRPAG